MLEILISVLETLAWSSSILATTNKSRRGAAWSVPLQQELQSLSKLSCDTTRRRGAPALSSLKSLFECSISFFSWKQDGKERKKTKQQVKLRLSPWTVARLRASANCTNYSDTPAATSIRWNVKFFRCFIILGLYTPPTACAPSCSAYLSLIRHRSALCRAFQSVGVSLLIALALGASTLHLPSGTDFVKRLWFSWWWRAVKKSWNGFQVPI